MIRRLTEWLMHRFVGRTEPDPERQEEIDRRLRNLALRVKVIQGGKR